jgi:hypothetical protein
MSLLESLPPGAMPFIAAVVAGVIGFILWRIFQLALKVVAFVVFLIVLVGMFAWWQPELFGLGKQVVQEKVLPGVDEATRDLQQKAKEAAKEAVKDAVRDAVGPAPGATPPTPAPSTPPTGSSR